MRLVPGGQKVLRTKPPNYSSTPYSKLRPKDGLDREGKDELMCYCQFPAGEHPTAFATLLGKVPPMQIVGSGGGPISHEFTVTFKPPHGA